MKKSVSTETDLWKLIKAFIPQPHRVSLPLCASLSVKDCCWALLSSPDPYLPLPLTFVSYQVSDDVAESSAGHGPHTQFNLLICHFLRDRGPFILQPNAKADFHRVQPESLLLKRSWDPPEHWWWMTYYMWICCRLFLFRQIREVEEVGMPRLFLLVPFGKESGELQMERVPVQQIKGSFELICTIKGFSHYLQS